MQLEFSIPFLWQDQNQCVGISTVSTLTEWSRSTKTGCWWRYGSFNQQIHGSLQPIPLPEVQLPHKCWGVHDHCCSQVFVQVHLQRSCLRWCSHQRVMASQEDRPLSQHKICFGNGGYLKHFCVSCAAHVSFSWKVAGAPIWIAKRGFWRGLWGRSPGEC